MAMPVDDYIVQPVAKALQVLDYVARQRREVTLTDIVQDLRMPKTTVFRYLQTLSAASFIHHNVSRDRYSLGTRFRGLAADDRNLQELRGHARTPMFRLTEEFGEMVNLAVLSGSQVVYIDILAAPCSLRVQARVGHRHPVHSTALGKAIAAHLPDIERERICVEPLAGRTSNTLTDGGAFRRSTADARRRGYAIDMEENEDGAMCIGVPILDAVGYPVAAMSMTARTRRMKSAAVLSAADALRAAAEEVSARLPARP